MNDDIETGRSEIIPKVFERASRQQRFLTLLLDTLFFYGFAFLVGVLLAILGLSTILENTPDLLVGILLLLLYYIPQEAIWGRTLGKLIIKTQVVAANGGAINFGHALGRTLCRFIPFEFLSFLGRSENGGPLGWHDRLPGTMVVSTK